MTAKKAPQKPAQRRKPSKATVTAETFTPPITGAKKAALKHRFWNFETYRGICETLAAPIIGSVILILLDVRLRHYLQPLITLNAGVPGGDQANALLKALEIIALMIGSVVWTIALRDLALGVGRIIKKPDAR